MPVSEDEKILSTWAIGKELRRGLLIGILSLLIASVGYLFYKYDKLQSDRAKFYEKMIDEKVNDRLREPIKNMKRVTNKMDTVADKASNTASKIDSVINEQIK